MTQQTTRAALEQALDALESLVFNTPYDGKYGDALAAGRAALLEAQPKREQLTVEQREWIVATCPTPAHIIDAVEAAHNIGGRG